MSAPPDLRVVPLPPPTESTDTLIALLETTLERVKDGDLTTFYLVAMMRGGGYVEARHAPSESNRLELIGALAHGQHCLHQLLDDENERTKLFTG